LSGSSPQEILTLVSGNLKIYCSYKEANLLILKKKGGGKIERPYKTCFLTIFKTTEDL